MDSSLSSIDWLIVACYLAASMAIGLLFGSGKQTTEGFLVGGRGIAWPLLLFSIVATETSTVTFLSLPGKSYVEGGNLTFLQLAFGYIVGRLLVVRLLLPLYFRGEYLTAYQILEERYGPSVRKAASLIFLVMRNLSDGLRLLLTGLLVQAATGLDFAVSVVSLALCTAAYAVVGGVKSVVVNDAIQFITYTVGAVAALVMLFSAIPDGAAGVWRFGIETGRLQLIDMSLSLTKPSVTLLAGVIGGAALTMASHGADQMMVQRYLCARSTRQAGIALALSGPVVLLQFLLFLVIGVALACHAQSLPTDQVVARGDEAFIAFIVDGLGVGLRGFVIASVLAASMSTMSSSVNASAGVLVTDFRAWLALPADGSKTVAAARIATVAAGLAQVAIALFTYYYGLNSSVIDAALAIAGFSTGVILGLYGLTLLVPGVTTTGGLCGLIAGFSACCFVAFRMEISWPWFSLIGATTTMFVGFLSSKLLGPTEGEA